MNTIGKVRKVEYFAGCTYVIEVNTSGVRRGVSLGNFVYVRLADDNAHFGTDPLLLHEYGHNVQSRQWGFLYLIVIGIPSLWSILNAVPLTDKLSTHDLKWYELQANRFAAMTRMKYFGKDWLEFEPPYRSFPTRRPVTIT